MDPRRRCNPCGLFQPSWNAVAKSWATVPKVHRDSHFFATLDFDDAQTVFTKLGLQSAPVVYVYPATEGPRKPESGRTTPFKYDFSFGFDPQPLAEQLSNHTPVKIPYRAPIDWSKWLTVAIGVLGLIVSAKYVAPIFTNRWSWAAICIIVSLVMTSGYMFTRIRASPWTGGGGQWIAAGFQNQFGQEVQVVAMIYGFLALAFLMLIVVAPYQSSPQRQRAQVYLWTAVIMIIYSILISLFRVKNRGYPFKLFL
jgi:oligosaccharyltransferase complex subunit gamma